MKHFRSTSVAEALTVLSLIGRRAPDPVRAAYLAGLRARGVAEPCDHGAAPALPRAWTRPDIVSEVFTETVLPELAEPERAAAAAALAALPSPGAGRRGRSRPEVSHGR